MQLFSAVSRSIVSRVHLSTLLLHDYYKFSEKPIYRFKIANVHSLAIFSDLQACSVYVFQIIDR